MQLPPTEIISIGNLFATSGMFPDIKSAAQAIVKIQAGQELGIGPFAAMSGIHIIQGKAGVGAGLIAARIKASIKYDYKVIALTNELCDLEFFEEGKGSVGHSKFDKEDAAKASTKNMEKYPRNMLFARAVSNGYRTYAPDVFDAPVYTPEELGSETVDAESESTTATPGTFTQAMAAVPLAAGPADARPELTKAHPDWQKCVDFVKTGAPVEKLSVRYRFTEEISQLIAAEARIEAAGFEKQPAGQLLTQAQIATGGPAVEQSESIDPNAPF